MVPGAIIHGAGHFYAGKIGTGLGILACEVVGTGLVFIGGMDEVLSSLEGAESSNSESGDVIMMVGVTMFVVSWTYDLIFAPIAVEKYNQRLLGKRNIGFNFDFDPRSDGVKLLIVKGF